MWNSSEKDFFRRIVSERRRMDLIVSNREDCNLTEEEIDASVQTLRQNSRTEHDLVVDIYLRTKYFKEAKKLFIYNSLTVEIDTSPIIKAAFKEGKYVYVPKVVDKVEEGGRMEFVEIFPTTEFQENNGILEPISDFYYYPERTEKKIEMVVPGLCFDKKGNRLGFGGAYYDRYVGRFGKETFHMTALAYDYQLFESIPTSEFDVPVDLIITDKNYLDLLM